MSVEEIPDGCHGGHLGQQKRTILAILNFHVATKPSRKVSVQFMATILDIRAKFFKQFLGNLMDNSLSLEFKSQYGLESLTISIFYFLYIIFFHLFVRLLLLLLLLFIFSKNGNYRYEYGIRLCIRNTRGAYLIKHP